MAFKRVDPQVANTESWTPEQMEVSHHLSKIRPKEYSQDALAELMSEAPLGAPGPARRSEEFTKAVADPNNAAVAAYETNSDFSGAIKARTTRAERTRR